MRNYNIAVLVLLAAIVGGVVGGYAMTQYNKPIPSSGMVILGNAYWAIAYDEAGLQPVAENGNVPFTYVQNSGQVYTATLYFHNYGKPMVVGIAWDNPNWSPSASTDLDVTMDIIGKTIPTGATQKVTLTMTVKKDPLPLASDGTHNYGYRIVFMGNIVTGGGV
jgi:hypothetical protein